MGFLLYDSARSPPPVLQPRVGIAVTHERNPIDCATLRWTDRIPNVHGCLLDEVRKQKRLYMVFELMLFLSLQLSVLLPSSDDQYGLSPNLNFLIDDGAHTPHTGFGYNIRLIQCKLLALNSVGTIHPYERSADSLSFH